MEKSTTMTREFKLENLGLPDTLIQPLIDNKLVYDFEYMKYYNFKNCVKFDNDYLKIHRYIDKLSDKVIAGLPESLEGVEYFKSINPFDKNDFRKIVSNKCGFDFATLLFKLGYCDGVISFDACLFTRHHLFNIPITVVDPNKREDMRKYFEELFGDDLENLNIEDFGWGVKRAQCPINYGSKKKKKN